VLRSIVLRVRFEDLCFAEAEYIQPLEHVPCVVWRTATAYYDLDGVERALPSQPE
jgi:hypothetical protein